MSTDENNTNPINIEGIDKAALIAALYNGTSALEGEEEQHDLGRDISAAEVGNDFELSDGDSDGDFFIDVYRGRKLGVTMTETLLLGWRMYDRHCPTGDGTCARIVDGLRP